MQGKVRPAGVERRRRFLLAVVLAVVAASGALFSGFQNRAVHIEDLPSTPTVLTTEGQSMLATAALGEIDVRDTVSQAEYSRSYFGDGWATVEGCDIRNRILQRDLADAVVPSENGCVVESGTLRDPYTGADIAFRRGAETSRAVQIDHVVALADAWRKGAERLTSEERHRFANDPLNLLAVDGPTNNAKGSDDAASWLPPDKIYRCRYVARQIAVKAKYRLWVGESEAAAMRRVLHTCPDQQLPMQTAPSP